MSQFRPRSNGLQPSLIAMASNLFFACSLRPCECSNLTLGSPFNCDTCMTSRSCNLAPQCFPMALEQPVSLQSWCRPREIWCTEDNWFAQNRLTGEWD